MPYQYLTNLSHKLSRLILLHPHPKTKYSLYFEDCNNELKREITRKLRRYFNKMRTAKDGKIKNPKNYLYVSMRNMFDKWQNDVLMAEKDEANNKN